MANNTITILAALQNAAAITPEQWNTINPDIDGDAMAAKFATMLAAQEKKRAAAKSAPRVKSKEQREAEDFARSTVEAMKAFGEPVTSDWLIENIPGIITGGKASGVMRTAQNLGLVRKLDKVRVNGSSRVRYEAL